MKLYDKECAVLAAIVGTNSLHVDSLAKITGFKSHTVRYNVSQLLDKKIIFKSVLINSSLLGYQTFNIFFSVPPAKRDKILAFLKGYSLVSWLAENSGDNPYEITCLARHVGEVEALFQEVSDRFDCNLEAMEWAAETEQNFLGYKHLAKAKLKPKPLTITWAKDQFICDDVDRKVLSALRSFPHSSEVELARKIGIPNSTLSYRLKKLRQEGVIVAEQIFIDPQALGLLEVQILVCLKHLRTEQVTSLREFIQNYPTVIAMIRCLGSWDYKLVVQVHVYAELFELQDSLRDKFPDLIKSLRMIPRRKLHQITPICPGV